MRARGVAERRPAERIDVRLSEIFEESVSYASKPRPGGVCTTRTVDAHVDALTRRSHSTGLSLPPEFVDRLNRVARDRPLSAHGEETLTFREFQEEGGRDRVALAVVKGASEVPEVQRIASDSMITEVVDRYLGYHARRVESWLFWSPANRLTVAEREAVFQTVRFHYDVHGYNFMYVNFYLSNVDENSGAHVLVEGTHRGKRLRHLLGSARLRDDQVRDAFGDDRVRIIGGPAGSGFFEDTSCYHKALTPISSDRLMLQLRYQ